MKPNNDLRPVMKPNDIRTLTKAGVLATRLYHWRPELFREPPDLIDAFSPVLTFSRWPSTSLFFGRNHSKTSVNLSGSQLLPDELIAELRAEVARLAQEHLTELLACPVPGNFSCPFCGNGRLSMPPTGDYKVFCSHCGASGPRARSQLEATAAWARLTAGPRDPDPVPSSEDAIVWVSLQGRRQD